MASSQNATKIVLLLSPHRIPEDPILLESLHISKPPGNSKGPVGFRFDMFPLDGAELKKNYSHLPKPATESLMWFNKAGMKWIEDEIQKKYSAQRSGLPFEPYYKSAMTRKLHELLERIKPFASLVKWYHKLPGFKGNYRTAPCTFSGFKPQLHFELKKENNVFYLETFVTLNGSAYPLDGFTRYHFLLESGNEYFLLSFKDYQTLEWLRDNDPQQYSRQPEALAQHVLARLEQDYTVDRNDLLAKTGIRVAPVNRVLLSEISKSFLVLTPQWLYDGFLIEGPWKDKQEIIRQGATYVVERDQEAETTHRELLESLHSTFSRQLNGYYYLSFAEAQKKQWFLKVYHRLLELNIQLVGMDMLQHFRYSPHKIVTEITLLAEDHHSATLRMSVSFGGESVLLTELQKMLRGGGRAMLLKDGSLGILHEEWLQQYGVLIRHGKITKDELISPRWLAFSDQEAWKSSGTSESLAVSKTTAPVDNRKDTLRPLLSKTWLEKWKHWQQESTPLYAVPALVAATLRPYQQKGFEWLLLLSEAGAGACLADDMGLGKTLQTICFLAYHSQASSQGSQDSSQASLPSSSQASSQASSAQGYGSAAARHLIVCPSSLIYNWQEELQKFAPSISSLVFHGPGRNIEDLEKGDYHIIITSYGTVRSDIDLLSEIPFGAVVLDESHNIKNPAAQITRAVSRLQAGTRIALSGTPVMNNTFDLYAQIDFLLPGLFGSREFFKREYADAIDRDNDPDKIRDLQKLTAPFILRRTKEQVAGDLPPKTEMVMWCDMNAAQKDLYDSIKENIRSSLFLNIKKEGLNKSKLAVLQGMLKLRQVCNSPLLLPSEEQTCTDSVKTDLLIYELTNNLKDQKVLVFSQFTSMLDLLAGACRNQGISFYHFDGQTPPHKRAEMVALFQEPEDKTNVFLISLKAGNAGLNLTAASYVFLVDPWWNTAVQQQAIDRTHRIGQTKNVFAYKMICKDTIEEKIISLQQRKKQLADDLVSEDEGFVKSLSEDDINYLFS
ncbi:DEAD/DEAH box helicase [Flavitalea flava]